jgi:hypothetical protein
MKELALSVTLIERLEDVYIKMETAYDKVAQELDFGCKGCPDNCCDSYFLHHTYVEWSYLWAGFRQLPKQKQEELQSRAGKYITACEKTLHYGERPQVMCPLNENGLCLVYKHRLMVCRTHGVPAVIIRPDGKRLSFPGCFRCQEKVAGRSAPPYVRRTGMLQELALLENDLLEGKRHLFPKVKLTIAEMLVKGPPHLPVPFCQR